YTRQRRPQRRNERFRRHATRSHTQLSPLSLRGRVLAMRIFELEITPLETSKQSALESKRAVVSWIESNTSLEIVETMSVRDTEDPTALFQESNALPFLVYGEEKELREVE